jgi:imidazole glycerol phosphate synthase glutamine amidotransferase subunit
VVIVPTGAANLASVVSALDRIGAGHRMARDAADVREATAVILPGVGSFGHAMGEIRGAGLEGVLRERIDANLATMGICLGMQVLASESEESPGVAGLGVIGQRVRRLGGDAAVRVPQMGWNRVKPWEVGHVDAGFAYYANSYAFRSCGELAREGWTVSATEHGGTFAAAIQRGNLLFTQFHPELSGAWGRVLMGRWLVMAGVPIDPEAARATAGGPGAGSSRGLASRVIPCLDVRDGRIVKGVRFQGLRDAGDPAERAAEYERQGADELVILDVSATPDGRRTAVETVRAVRRVLSIPLTVGGGVRAEDDAKRLLDAGADKVGVNTAAVQRPEILGELADRFGRQCVVLALDAARRGDGAGWEVVTHSGKTRTGIDALAWAAQAAELGAGEILLTSWDRDGTGHGYDTGLLGEVSARVGVPVIASGGASRPEHLVEALRAGADAVLAATIFHDGVHTVADVKATLASAGVEVRR